MIKSPPPRSRAGMRLSESAQLAIKQYLLDRKFRPGDVLPTEGRLAQEMGMSRTAVREAVKALEALGILDAKPGVGLIVRPFSLDPILDNLAYGLLVDGTRVLDLIFVRSQLEIGAVESVARTISPAQLRVLRSIVDRMGERVLRDEAFPEEDRFFHQALYAGLDNPLLLKLLDVFWQVYRRLRPYLPDLAGESLVRTWEGHRRIVEALERHDPDAAREAVKHHSVLLAERIKGAPPVPDAEGDPATPIEEER